MKSNFKSFLKIIMFVVFTVLLAGCSSVNPAEKVVNDTLTAFKNLDFQTMASNIDGEDETDVMDYEDEQLNVIIKPLAEKLSYKIVSTEEQDKDTSIVKTEITYINIKPIMADVFAEIMQEAFKSAFSSSEPIDDEKMEQMMIEKYQALISSDEIETLTDEIDITVKNIEGEWKIIPDDTLANVLTGGLVSWAQEIESAFNFE